MTDTAYNAAHTIASGAKAAAQKTAYVTTRTATHNGGETAAATIAVPQLGGIAGGLIGDFLASKVIYGEDKRQYRYIKDLSNPDSLLEFVYGAYLDSYPLSEVSSLFVKKTAKKEAKKAAKKAMKKISRDIIDSMGESNIRTALDTIIKYECV